MSGERWTGRLIVTRQFASLEDALTWEQETAGKVAAIAEIPESIFEGAAVATSLPGGV